MSRGLAGSDRSRCHVTAEVMNGETIAAISSPIGEGAIALIRVSGPEAVEIADRIFRGSESPSSLASHRQHLGRIVQDERVIDEVLLSVHRAPASYTGEDLVEISCHGGILIAARVLGVCLSAGARAARAGEFTERAFLNDKMDLTQAEAVMDLIRARTDLALRAATEQLQGRLGDEAKALREELVRLIAHVDAAIDFPEEDIAPDADTKLRARLAAIREQIAALLATADHGRILREGLRVVVAGPTNAGKSSLLNRFLGYERVIVSATHGTTRDTIEEMINLRGVPVRLLDTAGLRDSDDQLENAGIKRTEQALATADLVLRVFDASAPKPAGAGIADSDLASLPILNKCDLPENADWSCDPALRISCLTGAGLPELEDAILRRVGEQHLRPESHLAINARHRDCLRRALNACDRASATMAENLSGEYSALDLRLALDALTEMVGRKGDDEILDSVFRQFCIGK
ncbi:MAG TPA: tRNA uridine-5-carboxymethylaminomethyl(34) synthesis GTPase MnmE [Chthoniobacterales bacterium]|nr:tRNA uridine-5-carboxymethylaminomethyl(34) synthesis GTPase MnmE [Chthoniobacterales bacterium]